MHAAFKSGILVQTRFVGLHRRIDFHPYFLPGDTLKYAPDLGTTKASKRIYSLYPNMVVKYIEMGPEKLFVELCKKSVQVLFKFANSWLHHTLVACFPRYLDVNLLDFAVCTVSWFYRNINYCIRVVAFFIASVVANFQLQLIRTSAPMPVRYWV